MKRGDLRQRGFHCIAIAVGLACAGGCGTQVNSLSRVSGISYPTRGAGCDFEVRGAEMLPLDQMRYELVGTAFVSYPSRMDTEALYAAVRAEVRERLCEWGGTMAVISFDNSQVEYPGAIRPIGSTDTMVYLVHELAEGETSRYAERLGITDDKLKAQVAFDTDCATGEIEIVQRDEDLGSGRYVVQACGVRRKYQRQGTVYSAVPGKCDSP